MSMAKIMQQMRNEYEEQYLSDLEKVNANFIVGEDTEVEEEFDTFEEAREYAIQNGFKEIKVCGFAYCYGAYCDGDYREWDETILDLNKNVVSVGA